MATGDDASALRLKYEPDRYLEASSPVSLSLGFLIALGHIDAARLNQEELMRSKKLAAGAGAALTALLLITTSCTTDPGGQRVRSRNESCFASVYGEVSENDFIHGNEKKMGVEVNYN